MALQGDDEIDSLLALMGSGPVDTSTATPSASTATSAKPSTSHGAGSSRKPDGRGNQTSGEKTKKRMKKKKHKSKAHNDGVRKKRKGNDIGISFVSTRLSQNCFEWPRCNEGPGIYLGCGLLHNCKGYSLDDVLSHALTVTGECHSAGYGSTACQSCGESAASHELCLSSPNLDGADDSKKTFHPLSIMSVASIVVASRNARCLIGEHYPASMATEPQKKRPQKNELLPPLNSVASPPEYIPSALDMHVGKILMAVKKMRNELSKSTQRARNQGNAEKESKKICSSVSITATDVQLLEEKTSTLISTIQAYKKAVAAFDLSRNSNAKSSGAIDLIEKRLVAMAACDAIYYRCYYAAIVSRLSTFSKEGSTMAAMIPHPPTYFSCPGLAWDAQKSGVEAFRLFLGERNNDLDLAAPLNDSTKQCLLESWGLKHRLTDGIVRDGERDNDLLSLWQSRFLETLRHVWCTRYSRAKSPMDHLEKHKPKSAIHGRQVYPDDGQESVLKIHETIALSPALGHWRDSIRDYPANFYAYAAPTDDALHVISSSLDSAKIGQIVEAGAGTGYWSALLHLHMNHGKKQGVEPENGNLPCSLPVIAYDIAPPSSLIGQDDGIPVSNDYHGNIPTFTDVHRADSFSRALSATATSSAKTALLLCYPPPGSDMAQRALSAHISNDGQTVIHVGEWQGLTGDANFESLLTQNLSCLEKDVVHLPSWGTDATYLTIWQKKEENAQAAGTISCSPAFGYCSAQQCSNDAMRRCRYARCLQYCGLECFTRHSTERSEVLALHMIHVTSGNEVKYQNDCHFMDLASTEAIETVLASSERPKKKRKKKKRR